MKHGETEVLERKKDKCKGHKPPKGPKYFVCIEGQTLPWPDNTITTEEIAEAGGWDVEQGVIEVDEKDQSERTLKPGEVIELKPGRSFGKKHCWKRGFDLLQRMKDELALLKLKFPNVQYKAAHDGHWFLIDGFICPKPWEPEQTKICFFITKGHPGVEPYGFFISAEVRHNGQPPASKGPPNQPPFEGDWYFLSWSPVNWRPGSDVQSGENLWGWVRSFRDRLEEGV